MHMCVWRSWLDNAMDWRVGVRVLSYWKGSTTSRCMASWKGMVQDGHGVRGVMSNVLGRWRQMEKLRCMLCWRDTALINIRSLHATAYHTDVASARVFMSWLEWHHTAPPSTQLMLLGASHLRLDLGERRKGARVRRAAIS